MRKAMVFPRWKAAFEEGDTLDNWNQPGAEQWKIEDKKVMVCNTKESLVNIRKNICLEDNFKLSMEFKIAESYRELYVAMQSR